MAKEGKQVDKTDITPLYAIQQNEISRSIYRMSVNARKTIALAMAYRKLNQTLIEMEIAEEIAEAEKNGETEEAEELKEDLKELEAQDVLEVEFDVNNFFDIFEIEKTPAGIAGLAKTLEEITGFKVGIVNTPKKIQFLTWIQYAEIDKEEKKIKIEFSREIVKYLDSNEFGYCQLLLADIAEIKSYYAFRWLEIAQSYESLKGQKGNKKDEWHFERSIEEIRELFGIEKTEYQRFDCLKRKVIENPIAEINQSNIGIEITPEYKWDKNDKRRIKGIKVICKRKTVKDRQKTILAYKVETEEGKVLEVKKEIIAPEAKTEPLGKEEYEKFKKVHGSLAERLEALIESKNTTEA